MLIIYFLNLSAYYLSLHIRSMYVQTVDSCPHCSGSVSASAFSCTNCPPGTFSSSSGDEEKTISKYSYCTRTIKSYVKTEMTNNDNFLVIESHVVQEALVAPYALWDHILNFQVLN